MDVVDAMVALCGEKVHGKKRTPKKVAKDQRIWCHCESIA
jgi:hypothetical protein